MTDDPRPSSTKRLLDEWSNERKRIIERLQAESAREDTERLVVEHEARLGLHPPAATVRRVR